MSRAEPPHDRRPAGRAAMRRDGWWGAGAVARHTGLSRSAVLLRHRKAAMPAGRLQAGQWWWRPDQIQQWWQAHRGRRRRLTDDDGNGRWDVRQVAAHTGLSVSAVRGHRSVPDPAGLYRGRLVWEPAAIRAWWDDRQLGADRWGIERVAEEVGLSPGGIKSAVKRHTFPAPDGRAGRRAWWTPQTVRRAAAHRAERARAVQAARAAREAQRTAACAARDERRRRRRADAAAAAAARVGLDENRWNQRAVARRTGLSYETIRTYRRLGLLPPPDGMTGVHPWWRPDTILAWDAQRLSSGTGRPRGRDSAG